MSDSKYKLVGALLVILAVSLGGYATRKTWLRIGAESLVCSSTEAPSDAVLIDHVDDNYLLFERAQRLQAGGLASIVLVPILSSESNGAPNTVSIEFVDVMCRIARASRCITFHAPADEPISLNLARGSAHELRARGVKSVLLVTDGFRSERALMVYSAVLAPIGITVHCQPVFGTRSPLNWFESLHGIQEVALQFIKLWYYRLVVMPRARA